MFHTKFKKFGPVDIPQQSVRNFLLFCWERNLTLLYFGRCLGKNVSLMALNKFSEALVGKISADNN